MWIKWLNEDKIINISNVDEMDQEAQAKKEILLSQDIMSVLVLPLSYNNKLKGFVGFDNLNKYNVWQKSDETLLYLLAEVLLLTLSPSSQ